MFEYLMKKVTRRKNAVTKITLGICAMDKKSRSKPMQEILSRFPADLFDIRIFGDDCILRQPVEDWPVVECLVAFYSNHYPLEKALEYIRLRKPFLVNDLEMQSTLADRRRVYELLTSQGIDVPRHIYVQRQEGQEDTNVIEEFDEYIMINGEQLKKPFVEKPVDADDHNIYIYYPMSAGGGSKRLFRKVQDRSSQHYRKINEVRRVGSYIYEEFLVTQGTDVKVYTVGADYGHAEARKSPVVDGKVIRNKNGLEVRYPVILSAAEKEMSRKITLAFKQTVCGFDILRVPGKSYVCDVNGFSFVKNSRKYYDDCSQILVELMLTSLRPEYHATLSAVQPLLRSSRRSVTSARPAEPYKQRAASSGSPPNVEGEKLDGGDGIMDTSMSSTIGMTKNEAIYEQEELVCVIGVFRHGDRTPKQKIKLKVKEQAYLDYYHEHGSSPKKDLKIKSKSGLEQFLRITRELLEQQVLYQEKNEDLLRKLKSIRFVLERWEISGINRKLQIKPLSWEEIPIASRSGTPDSREAKANSDAGEIPVAPPLQKTTSGSKLVGSGFIRCTEVLLILKWGGDLTPHGRIQAAQLGADFRDNMYPHPSGGGMLRLHSTFRHDLKIKASDEGRVMKTAAAFTKGMLELEGNLTPVLVSLVSVEEKNSQMLDHYGNQEIKELMDMCKSHIDTEMQKDVEMTPEVSKSIAPSMMESVREALNEIGNAKEALHRIHELVGTLCEEISYCYSLSRIRDDRESSMPASPSTINNGEKKHAWPSQDQDFDNTIEPSAKLSMCSATGGNIVPESPLVEAIRKESEVDEGCTGEASAAVALSTGSQTAPGTPQRTTPADDEADEHDNDDVTLEETPGGAYGKRSQSRENAQIGETDSDNGIFLPDLYLRETYDLMLTRWEKLYKDFYHKDTDKYDLTKVPDIYDMARYDVLHNQIALLPSLGALFEQSRLFSLAVVPQEYGIGVKLKRFLGTKMCHAFLTKILKDITIATSDDRHTDMSYLLDSSHADDLNIRTLGRSIRTRLYFTSESHLHTLLNVLRYACPGQSPMLSEEGVQIIAETKELSYLTHVVFRMFERKNVAENDPKRFRFEILFSPGANADPREDKSANLAPPVIINGSLPCDDLMHGLTAALELSNSEHTEYLKGCYHQEATTTASNTPTKADKKKISIASPDECSDEWETDYQERKGGRKIAINKSKNTKTVGKPPMAPLSTVSEVAKSVSDISMKDNTAGDK